MIKMSDELAAKFKAFTEGANKEDIGMVLVLVDKDGMGDIMASKEFHPWHITGVLWDAAQRYLRSGNTQAAWALDIARIKEKCGGLPEGFSEKA